MELHNSEDDSKEFHVLMFPWLAHGHISAFLELAKRLATNGVTISFLSTPQNISKLKKQPLPTKIGLLELDLPSVDGLPPGIENTGDLPTLDLMPLLKEALDGWEKPFQSLLRLISPDVVIFDLVQHWAPLVAASLHIPTVFFSSFSASTVAYAFSYCCKVGRKEAITVEDLTKPSPDLPSSATKLRLFEARAVLPFFTATSESGISDMDRLLVGFRDCSAIAMKSCFELEDNKYGEYIERITGKPVFPVGPLLPYNQAGKVEDCGSDCLSWLEKQETRSVIYVCFGTECLLSQQQIEEIALGLEASRLCFLWVLRLPEKMSVSVSLPSGFEDRTRDRGLVWREWAPQREILFHSSTGGFLTHCGWNSLMEGMSAGLPFVLLPMQYDQGLNARLLAEELRIGVEVEREEESGYFSREDICKAVRRGMVEEDGMELRSNAAEMGKVFNSKILCEGSQGAQNRCINQFIKSLRSLTA